MSDRPAPPPLPEDDAALFETLPEELARALYPDQTTAPFRVTMIYPALDGDARPAAAALQAAAVDHELIDAGDAGAPRHRTTFSLLQIEEFHELYHLAESTIGAAGIELRIDGRPVPLARELWLPLLWTLRA